MSRTNRRGSRKVCRSMIALSKAHVIRYGVFMWHHGLTLLKDIVSRKELNHLEQSCMWKRLPLINIIAHKKESFRATIQLLHGVGQSDRHHFCRFGTVWCSPRRRRHERVAIILWPPWPRLSDVASRFSLSAMRPVSPHFHSLEGTW